MDTQDGQDPIEDVRLGSTEIAGSLRAFKDQTSAFDWTESLNSVRRQMLQDSNSATWTAPGQQIKL